MAVTFDVVSIGTLSHNPFWGETKAVRTPHATTTLVRDGTTTILVDPSLPGEVLETDYRNGPASSPPRSGGVPDDLAAGAPPGPAPVRPCRLADRPAGAGRDAEAPGEAGWASSRRPASNPTPMIVEKSTCCSRCKPAPEKLTANVHLFPTPGPPPAAAGLLVASPLTTAVVAGDAVLTRELPGAWPAVRGELRSRPGEGVDGGHTRCCGSDHSGTRQLVYSADAAIISSQVARLSAAVTEGTFISVNS